MNINRQYIGARYVPLVFGEWVQDNAYDALTIVTYNNNSYTSKRTVPAGAPITDTTYWVQTGTYNAQIAQLQTEMANVQKVNGAQVGVTTKSELKNALLAGYTNIIVSADITIDEMLTISNEGVKLIGVPGVTLTFTGNGSIVVTGRGAEVGYFDVVVTGSNVHCFVFYGARHSYIHDVEYIGVDSDTVYPDAFVIIDDANFITAERVNYKRYDIGQYRHGTAFKFQNTAHNSNNIITNCRIAFAEKAFDVGQRMDGVTISDCVVTCCAHGIIGLGGSNFFIDSCVFDQVFNTACTLSNADNVKFSNCYFGTVTAQGIRPEPGSKLINVNSVSLYMVNCSFYCVNTTPESTGETGAYTVAIFNCSHARIMECHFTHSPDNGVIGWDDKAVYYVSNCDFDNCPQYPIPGITNGHLHDCTNNGTVMDDVN